MKTINFLIIFIVVLFVFILLKALFYGVLFFIWLIKTFAIVLPFVFLIYFGYKIKNRQ